MNKAKPQDLRQILGKFLTGVTVVTTLDQHDVPVGFTANSFTSVSLDPPLVLVCIAQSAGLASVFRRANAFAINILSTEQEAISNNFARKDEDRFADIDWKAKQTGSPIIKGSAAWLDCNMHEKIVAGDHIILIGRIIGAEKSTRHPLGYYQGQYCAIDLPEATLSVIERQESVHSSAGVLVDHDDHLLFIKNPEGQYDVPRVLPSRNGDGSNVVEAMTEIGIDVRDKALFSIVEGRHHQRLSIYYRCQAESIDNLSDAAEFFPLDVLPLDELSFPYLGRVLQRYVEEKRAGQFAIYVGEEHQGYLEKVPERKI